MKTKVLFLVIFLCAVSGYINNISAQETLKALVVRCETMDEVSVSIVHQRDRETKQTTQIVKSLKFTDNKSLKDEFLAAFDKDKDEAIQVIEKKKDGKIVPSYYQFADGDFNVSYTIKVSEDGLGANISIISQRVNYN